jgi:Na+/proline symporter
MFIGLVGDYMMWRGFHGKLREYSEKHPVNTIPALTSQNPALESSPLRILSAILTLLFLSVYAAAQLKAGSKALHVMFDWPVWLGAVLGWVAAGIGVIGQPHILIRTIALRSPADVPTARRVYFAWYLPFAIMTVTIGLYARVLLAGELTDPELTLPIMAQTFLPEVLAGMVLAAIFAATLSTADSMLLSCSAAISQDLIPRFGQSYVRTKIGTLGITLVVLAVALAAPADVFTLVVFAWSSLGGTLRPVIVLRVMNARLTRLFHSGYTP